MATASMWTKLKIAEIRHFFDEYNRKNVSVIDELGNWYAPNVVLHQADGTEVKGLDAYKQWQRAVFTAFPDIYLTIEDMVLEEDKVALRYTWTGTFKGKMGDIAPTGKKVTQTVFGIGRYEGGKVAEMWEMANMLSMYQQMGVSPTPETK